MIGGGRTSYHHNLIAHHDSRTPRYVFRSTDPTTKEHPTDWRNNVIYNFVRATRMARCWLLSL